MAPALETAQGLCLYKFKLQDAGDVMKELGVQTCLPPSLNVTLDMPFELFKTDSLIQGSRGYYAHLLGTESDS